jgi:hypothetical protein
MPSWELALATYQDPVSGAISVYAGDHHGGLQKLNGSSGSIIWSETVNANWRALAVDGSGNVYGVGEFGGTVDFDPGPGTAYLSSPNGVAPLKLDPSGNLLSVWHFGGNGTPDSGSGLALDAGGNVYTAGAYSGTWNFDTGSQTVSLTSPGSTSLFVTKTTQDMGSIFGQVFNDLNDNGIFDSGSGETGVAGVTVYLDLNNNGALDPGEPTAVTGSQGQYEFDHLAPGSYTVRQVLQPGWIQTSPSGNAGLAVTVAAGLSADTENFGTFTPNTTRTYSNNVPVRTSHGKPNAISTLAISDPYTIFDLHLTLNVSNTNHKPLTVVLHGPDGTAVTLIGSTNFNGTVTFETPAFDFKKVTGTWTLEVDGLAGGTLNSWSLGIDESNS